ncbi:hypothetical protein LA080_015861 [Diaporthe eres]|nr:hypothetical protein LA080_015861 [Diaporthe eres]
MDPVSAIGVVAPVLQFADSGAQGISKAREISHTSTGRTALEDELLTSVDDLDRLSQGAPQVLQDTQQLKTNTDIFQKYASDRFSPPLPEYELTFNKSCRFIEVSLEADGVHIIGHLWKLGKEAIETPWRQFKKLDAVKTLWVLHEYIEGPRRNAKIAHTLRKFLMNSKTSKSLANEYMWKIAEKVADALHNRKKLMLGYLYNSSADWSPPMGIFVCPDEAMESHGSKFVFTSFRASRKTSDVPAYAVDVDKQVSLQGAPAVEKLPEQS